MFYFTHYPVITTVIGVLFFKKEDQRSVFCHGGTMNLRMRVQQAKDPAQEILFPSEQSASMNPAPADRSASIHPGWNYFCDVVLIRSRSVPEESISAIIFNNKAVRILLHFSGFKSSSLYSTSMTCRWKWSNDMRHYSTLFVTWIELQVW